MSILFASLLLQLGCTKHDSHTEAESPDWEALLVEGAKITNNSGTFTLRLTNIAEITISSGKIVACDGFVFHDDPLPVVFPLGKFPLTLAVAQFSNDQRVACAMINLKNAKVTKWSNCGEYGVDSSTGCYMDVKSARLLRKQTEKEPNYYLKVIAEMEKQRLGSVSAANIVLEENSLLNCVLFESGFGDGSYECFVGYDETGEAAKLVTNFRILSP